MRAPVIIESPCFPGRGYSREENMAYLDEAIRFVAVDLGMTPYASHKMLVGPLDDDSPEEREAGIQAGFAMARHLLYAGARRMFFLDHGMSRGMRRGLLEAIQNGEKYVGTARKDTPCQGFVYEWHAIDEIPGWLMEL